MHPARRRLAFLSAAIVVLALILPAGIASAASGPAAGNRVWAFSSAAQVHVRADRLVSAVQRLGGAASCPFYASGACVAAEDGGAAALRGAVERQYQDVVGSQSIRARGPVLSGAMNTQTGDIYFGQNTGIPDLLAPQLRSALDEFDGPGAAGKGIPGAHSEFNAVNQGLLANPESQISDYLFYSVRLRGSLQGEPIDMCSNCAGILGP
jgi:YwqJ-like deaminase